MNRKIKPVIKIIIITIAFSFGHCGKNHIDSLLLLTDKDSISIEINMLLNQVY